MQCGCCMFNRNTASSRAKNVVHATNQDLFNITYNSDYNRFCCLAMCYSNCVELVHIYKMDGISMGYLSQPFTNHRTAGEGGGHFFISSLPLPPASQTLRHYPGDYCRELTSAHM